MAGYCSPRIRIACASIAPNFLRAPPVLVSAPNVMTTLIDHTSEATVRDICSRYGDRPDALLEILHGVQAGFGYLADDALRTVADALNISRAEIHGVASFYHDFRRDPPAAHTIKLCRAEACQAVGSEELAAHAEKRLNAKTGGRSADGAIDLKAIYCLGNCALGPAAMIDDRLHARMTPEKFDGLITGMERDG